MDNSETREGIRTFTCKDGRTIEMTEEEFGRLVDYFRLLSKWDRELKEREKGNIPVQAKALESCDVGP